MCIYIYRERERNLNDIIINMYVSMYIYTYMHMYICFVIPCKRYIYFLFYVKKDFDTIFNRYFITLIGILLHVLVALFILANAKYPEYRSRVSRLISLLFFYFLPIYLNFYTY